MKNQKQKVEKLDHISYSQIQTAKCLYKYLRLRLLKDIEEDNLALQLGSLVHQVIYKYTSFCIKNKTDSDFGTYETIYEQVFNEEKYPEEIYQEGKDITIKFCEREIGYNKILDHEHRRRVKIGEDKEGKDIILELVIDRVNSYTADYGNVIEIIDYKNQVNILSPADVQKHEQLNIYKYAAAKHLYKNNDWIKIGVWHTRWDFCRWGELQKISDLAVEFDNIEKYLLRQWDRIINAEEYVPKRCGACWDYGQCAVMAIGECPLWTEKEMKDLSISGKIEDKIHAYRKLDADAKALKKIISKHFETNSAIEVDDKKVGYEKRESVSYLVKPWHEYTTSKEINIDDITISKTEAEKAINKWKKIKNMDGEELRELEPMQQKKMSSTFKI